MYEDVDKYQSAGQIGEGIYINPSFRTINIIKD